ncbi:MAG TPA: riboflavin synthase [Puia sp.]|nr:riboflavin synthase [Puia sp.]
MFTGIIESFGKIVSIDNTGTNRTFWIESPISHELSVDQSVSHDGVCLTVEETHENRHRVTAIRETLEKSAIGYWRPGNFVNLERCLRINDRLDGHIVQGHVDTTGTCLERRQLDGSWEFRIEFPKKFRRLVIEKGSISLNGISLTIFNVKKSKFDIAVIPYTFEHTNIQKLNIGSIVNLEFDLIGKYVAGFTHDK